MTQDVFVRLRKDAWDRVEACLSSNRKEFREHAAWMPKAFRELTQDLNTAKSNAFEPDIIARLNRLVTECSHLLYRRRRWSFSSFLQFLSQGFPRAVRAHWRLVAAAHLLFYGISVFTGVLVLRYPDTVFELMPESTVHNLREMYNPDGDHFLMERKVDTSADMFGFYIHHNISIAFQTFAGGILFGIGSLFVLCLNGMFLGAVSGHIIEQGFAHTFFPFVIGHSSFELTAIILSACAGLHMGFSIFVTRGMSRSLSLRNAGKSALPLIAGASIMLVIAAMIEAFWSSRHTLPLNIRYGAGAFGWLCVLMFLGFSGRTPSK
ncbi:MAG: stage II sporulation protein M [Spirochaetales bacterium]|nr:stage II sporulation protein M [Spirochaetales bacterium]